MAAPIPVNVAVIGVGLVGSEFISQLLGLPQPSPFKLISLTSSSRTLFSPSAPLAPGADWKAAPAKRDGCRDGFAEEPAEGVMPPDDRLSSLLLRLGLSPMISTRI